MGERNRPARPEVERTRRPDGDSLREAIEILGVFSMFGLSVYAALVWWMAFQNGGTVVVDIDAAGELWIEFGMWLVLAPLVTLGMYFYLNGERR